jgi:hypothetical protein
MVREEFTLDSALRSERGVNLRVLDTLAEMWERLPDHVRESGDVIIALELREAGP